MKYMFAILAAILLFCSVGELVVYLGDGFDAGAMALAIIFMFSGSISLWASVILFKLDHE